MRSERFVDMAPAEVHATLLDEGVYYCSVRTMYRILDACKEVKERRRQTQHPRYVKPQLIANSPNQVWSWDITKLLEPVKWTYFYLYVVLDIYSRYVVGWMLAERESAILAERLLTETCQKQEIVEDWLLFPICSLISTQRCLKLLDTFREEANVRFLYWDILPNTR